MSEPVPSIGTQISRLAELAPDAPAVSCDGHTITRAELDTSTNRLARAYAERGIGVGDSLERGLDRTERALAKLDDGTYGMCDACGAPIARARLTAMPDAVRCLECAASERRVHSPRRTCSSTPDP